MCACEEMAAKENLLGKETTFPSLACSKDADFPHSWSLPLLYEFDMELVSLVTKSSATYFFSSAFVFCLHGYLHEGARSPETGVSSS